VGRSLGWRQWKRVEAMMTTVTGHSQPSNPFRDAALRQQLIARRNRIAAVLPQAPAQKFQQFLGEIDAALERMEAGTFGICETCHDSIENERLLADPLARNCLDHLSPAERRTLERDLDLALEVQKGLLPAATLEIGGCEMAYCYRPLGPVSGDYCDVLPLDDGAGLFMLGDVSGKGVAASMLMAQLNATFRSLAIATTSVTDLVGKANRVFCQGNPTCHFATLICGHIDRHGNFEICNAGHCPPLRVSGGEVTRIESMGLPVGVVCDGEYPSQTRTLNKGDSLVMYTDGLTESFNAAHELYGSKRLADLVARHTTLPPKELLAAILEDVAEFQAGHAPSDDLTIMILRRGE
jgi:sigma-B regulation protein RsbU (phosphoserine phosphatase)